MAQSDNFYSKPTSVFWACKALTDGRTITQQDEMAEIGAWRLGAVIHRFKTEYHWPILVEYRGPEKVAHYWLNKDLGTATLRFPPSKKSLVSEGGAA